MEEGNDKSRFKIALWVTYLAIGGTVVLGIAGIIFSCFQSTDDKRIQSLQYTFTALLPLWGTWMGTVMAYYFSKENFLAANNSVQKLIDQITPAQKLEATKCSAVMITMDKIKPFKVKDPKPVENNALADAAKQQPATPPGSPPSRSDLNSQNNAADAMTTDPGSVSNIRVLDAIEFMNDFQIPRLPLFQDKKLQYIIHSSTFEKFITEVTFSNSLNLPVNDLTIKDMFQYGSDKVKGYLQYGALFLSEDSNLKQAQGLIEKNIFCQDVFITKMGDPNEEVIGWITNTIIAENAKI